MACYLVREARIQPPDFDLLGVRGTYHLGRILELVDKFPVWREQRIPGPRAFDSTYDRVGVLVCRWLFQAIHDVQAISTFDYILPLMVIVVVYIGTCAYLRFSLSFFDSVN